MGDEVELLVDEAQAVEDHGGNRRSQSAFLRVLLCRVIKDLSDAEFFKHPRN